MVVECVCPLAVCAGRICHLLAGLFWVPNWVSVAADQELNPPAVRRESQTASELLKKHGLNLSLEADVENLRNLSCKPGDDEVRNNAGRLGNLFERTNDKQGRLRRGLARTYP